MLKTETKNKYNGVCPVCSKPTTEAMRPFCSKRCANVDLNRWLSDGYYSIPISLDEASSEDLQRAEKLED